MVFIYSYSAPYLLLLFAVYGTFCAFCILRTLRTFVVPRSSFTFTVVVVLTLTLPPLLFHTPHLHYHHVTPLPPLHTVIYILLLRSLPIWSHCSLIYYVLRCYTHTHLHLRLFVYRFYIWSLVRSVGFYYASHTPHTRLRCSRYVRWLVSFTLTFRSPLSLYLTSCGCCYWIFIVGAFYYTFTYGLTFYSLLFILFRLIYHLISPHDGCCSYFVFPTLLLPICWWAEHRFGSPLRACYFPLRVPLPLHFTLLFVGICCPSTHFIPHTFDIMMVVLAGLRLCCPCGWPPHCWWFHCIIWEFIWSPGTIYYVPLF